MNEVIVWGTIYFDRPIAQGVLSNSIDVTTLVIVTMASIAAMGVIIYFWLKMGWAKFLGRWFPWAGREEGDDKKLGCLSIRVGTPL